MHRLESDDLLLPECDVLIIGAGPVGLYASYYAGFRGLSAIVVDSLEEVGGQISAMYPEKNLYDIAGFPGIRGRDLVSSLMEQARTFEHPMLLGHQAQQLTQIEGGYRVSMSGGRQVTTKTVLLTSGIGTFTPRPPGVGEQFLGQGLSYFVPDPSAHAGEDIVIIGGGDSAVDWALTLEGIGRSVTLVHRRDQFRAHAHSVKLLHDSTVHVITKGRLTAVHGTDRITAVEIDHAGEHLVLPADHLVSALGFVADLGPLLDWGLAMRGRYVEVDQRMQTSRAGIYAAGDLSDFDGKVRLLAVGFGEAATAINNLAVQLNSSLSLMPPHSSDQLPGVAA